MRPNVLVELESHAPEAFSVSLLDEALTVIKTIEHLTELAVHRQLEMFGYSTPEIVERIEKARLPVMAPPNCRRPHSRFGEREEFVRHLSTKK